MADWLSSAFGYTTGKEEEKKPSPAVNGAKKAAPTKATTPATPAAVAAASAAPTASKGKAPAANGTKKEAELSGSSSSSSSQPLTNGTAANGAAPAPAKKTDSSLGNKNGSSPSSDPKSASASQNGTKLSSANGSAASENKGKAPGQAEKAAAEKSEAAKPSTSTVASTSSTASTSASDSIQKRTAAAAAAAASAGTEASKKSSAAPNANNPSSVAKAGALRRIRVTEALPELISQANACAYEPAEYFVAWQGVLTIIYSGIPPSLCRLKAKMSEQFPGLPPENPGSLWPKTSLACLKDDKRLSPEQLQTLRDICSKMNFQLVYSPPIHVSTVSIVMYENCCLEKQLVSTHIQLQQPEDPSPVSEEQKAHVRKVADEFSAKNVPNYWFHVSKDGNRSKHYRQNKSGATLVHFLGDEVPPSVATFQRLVEAAMPGMYDWFPPESLHITLRSLC